MNLEFQIYTIGVKDRVFNHTVAKTFLTLQEIAQFKTYDEGYQRERDLEHEAKIIEYLKNSSNRYLPDIIVSLRHQDIDFGNKILLSNENFYLSTITGYEILRIQIKKTEAFENLKIIDGNHRISAIKQFLTETPNSDLSNLKIGVTFVLTQDREGDYEDELALFYYLNSKAKPLLPHDYLNEATENLSDEKAKSIDWWMYVFKISNVKFTDMFKDYYIDINKLKNNISISCDYLAKKIPINDNEGILDNFFDRMRTLSREEEIIPLLQRFIDQDKLYNFINILFYLDRVIDDIDKMQNEFIYFYDWLKNEAKLEDFEDFENLYKTYKETYVPRDFKIFVAMEFYKRDKYFKAIEKTIEKVKKETKLPLECIRIDNLQKGHTYQIMDEILHQIQRNGLLLADITNKNANVYLEVGFAMGLAKAKGMENQIMFFVEKSDSGSADVGFDLQSYQQNRYDYGDTGDLRDQLEAQLLEYYKRFLT
ncbi:DNA sulfur modification protein DndB [Sulfurospirillum arcachonense]|uniref:DNA sulfur modification protein DndB n=1 Tax=Sulfurospirillum arcachonense TaxID=57666 RepID=UPI0004695D8A|nr:DNA sulfur modification protein DndB [Sulfurospirillum arcachonense]